jgi:hypothetical protein
LQSRFGSALRQPWITGAFGQIEESFRRQTHLPTLRGNFAG